MPELALAIGNLGAPGGLTRSVVLSLGAGLSLLVAVALADASLVQRAAGAAADAARPTTSCSTCRRTTTPAIGALIEQRGARRRARGGADAARAARAPQRHAGRGRSRRRPRRSGCSTATAGCPIRTTVPHGSKVVAGDVVADRTTTASRSSRSRPSSPSKLGLEDRRHGHGQRARPQRDGAHRQPARGEVGEPRHQLRDGVLAQHAARRAAQPAGDDRAAARHAARRPRRRRCARSGSAYPVGHRHPRQGRAAMRSTRCSPR